MIEDREEPCRPSCPAGDCANCVRFDLTEAKPKTRKPQRNTWTPAEDQVVMDNYRSVGWAFCQGQLPTFRTEFAIRSRARYLERKARGGTPARQGKALTAREPGPRHAAFMAAAGRKFLDINRFPRASSIFNLAQGITV